MERAGLVRREEVFKGETQHRELLVDGTAFAQCVTEGEAKKEGARGRELFGDLSDDRQTDGRDATAFDLPCYQSHGPVTDPSGGDQKRVIQVRLDDLIGHLWRRALGECLYMWTVDMSHKAKAHVVDAGENSVRDELA